MDCSRCHGTKHFFSAKVLPIIMLIVMATVLSVGGIAVPGCSEAAVDETGRPLRLRFADSGIEGLEELSQRYAALAAEIQRITGVRIEFFSLSNRGLASIALEMGDVDLVLAGPSEYVAIRRRVDVEPLVGLERPRYLTVFVVPQDHPAQTLADLRGLAIGMKDHGSTTGHVIPGYMLVQAGLNLDTDVRLQFLGGTRVAAMLSGDIQVLAAGIRDYDELVRRAGEGRFRILAQSPPMPKDLIVIRPGFPAEFVEELRQAFLDNQETILQAMMADGRSNRYVDSRIVPVVDSEYDIVRDAYRALRLPLD